MPLTSQAVWIEDATAGSDTSELGSKCNGVLPLTMTNTLRQKHWCGIAPS